MIAVDQTILHSASEKGNCMQAAVASLLNLPLEAVPDFNKAGDGFWTSFHRFILEKGLYAVNLDRNWTFPFYHLAYGSSPRGIRHAVVWRNNKLAHDPHPSRLGLIQVDQICLLVPMDVGSFIGGRDAQG